MKKILIKSIKSVFIKIVIVLSIIFLASCSKYQKYLGGKSANYDEVKTTTKLHYPNGVNGLKKGDRYSIPVVQSSNDIVEITPPDFNK